MTNTVNINFLITLKNTMEIELRDLKNAAFYKEETINDINKVIIENCLHEWETDFIDSMKNYKLSQPIKYCVKCSLTDNAAIT